MSNNFKAIPMVAMLKNETLRNVIVFIYKNTSIFVILNTLASVHLNESMKEIILGASVSLWIYENFFIKTYLNASTLMHDSMCISVLQS